MSIKKRSKKIWTNKGYECHDLGAIRNFLSKERADGYIRDICNHTDQNYNCEKVNLLLIKISNKNDWTITKNELASTLSL